MAVELVERRTKNAKVYRNNAGSYTSVISPGPIHYQSVSGGSWLDKRRGFKTTANGFISDESDVVMEVFRTGSGGSAKWWVEFREKLTGQGIRFQLGAQPVITAGQNSLSFPSPSGDWSYHHTRSGGKLYGPPVAASVGVGSAIVDYLLVGGAPALTTLADGTVACGNIFTLPKPHLVGADNRMYETSAWQIDDVNGKLTFKYSDTALPASAYPYKVDPSTSFVVAVGVDDAVVERFAAGYPPETGGSFSDTATAVEATRHNWNPNFQVHNGLMRWDTSSLPDNAVIAGASLDIAGIGGNSADARSMSMDWFVFVGNMSDYISTAQTNAFAGKPIADIPKDNSVSRFALLDAATNINKTGTSGLRMHVTGGQPTGLNNIQFASFDHTTVVEPKLVVDWALPHEVLRPNGIVVLTNLTGTAADIDEARTALDAAKLVAP